jgi:beta-glucosidase
LLGQNLTDFVNNGTVPLARVNDAAVRLMTPYFALGQDKIDFPALPNNISVGGEADKAHIRLAGAASAVLLKNKDGALPLNKPKHLALFGFDAAAGPGGPNLPGLGLQVNAEPPVFIPLGPTGGERQLSSAC